MPANLTILAAMAVVCCATSRAADTLADEVIVNKGKRELLLLNHGKVIKAYRVALGRNPVGLKHREGDGRTPEGRYVIDGRYEASQFHRALHISYPSAADRVYAKKLGMNPGGAIMIHGLPNGQGAIGRLHVLTDWTEGCIAVTNEEIGEIWRLVPNGTTVVINP